MHVAIVTDATTDLPAQAAAEHGIALAPLGYTVGGRRYTSDQQDAGAFLTALAQAGAAEIAGVEADDFEAAFRAAAKSAPHLICICQSVGSSFTRVSAEVAARRLQEDGVAVDVTSPGRSTAAAAAIALAAADAARNGADAAAVTALIDAAATHADTFLIAADLTQLERAGQLAIVASQSGVGPLDDGAPLFRLRGRLTALSVEDDAAAAEAALLDRVEATLDDRPALLVATHAGAPADAARLLAAAQKRVDARSTLTTVAGPTITSLLGAGCYGLGFCAAPGS